MSYLTKFDGVMYSGFGLFQKLHLQVYARDFVKS